LQLSASDISDSRTKTLIEEFEAAMDNDFNSPEALVSLEQTRNQIMQELDALAAGQAIPEGVTQRVYAIRQLGALLGLFFDSLETVETEALKVAAHRLGVAPLSVGEVEAVVKERSEARTAKNFARSDELRAYLIARGVDVLDSKAGSRWRIA
jgi:cysteinyl-tRNA synthetase